MNKFADYQKAVSYLEGLSNVRGEKEYMKDRAHPEMYLKRMRAFLNLLGNPDRGTKYIHVTGTAGKGTVTTMLHEILLASGKKVGSFTSPYVTTTIEKIRVGEKYISPDEFVDLVEQVKPAIDEMYMKSPYGRPSIFEILHTIGFLYFKKQKCEWGVLEVGCGGRYDATNVIEKSVAAAITNVDYDHMEILGDTLEKIAYDKAGIIKRGTAFFTTEKRPKILKIFERACLKTGASFHVLSSQNSRDANVVLATAIASKIGISTNAIEKGLSKTCLPARFEIMQKKPMIIIDGAHNRAKIKSTVENLKKISYRKLHLVLGVAENKNYQDILSQIIPFVNNLYLTRFQTKERKAAQPKELARLSKKYLKKAAKIKVFLDPNEAFLAATKNASPRDLILVTGSFFLAGEIRQLFIPEEQILKKRVSF